MTSVDGRTELPKTELPKTELPRTELPRTELPRTDRPDAPAYLTRYQQRIVDNAAVEDEVDSGVPLYLRRFRARGTDPSADTPMWEGEALPVTREWADVTRTKEIVPERREQMVTAVTDVYLVRHGETQGYSSESGLTPLGSWQSHRRGQEIARRVQTGQRVTIACADTNRARQTAQHLRRGLLDNAALFGRDPVIGDVTETADFANFAVTTPDGPRDVTAAFRRYHREMERYERIGLGERPGWLVEVDRFWAIQQGGGDPITHWLSMPLMYFEPPIACVRRFWTGILRLQRDRPGANVVVATHSGPIRAFATWAFGYDPGEPFNAEFVRVRLIEGGTTALVLYRNRVQEVRVPDVADLEQTR
jgi:broad specificity phosphatase PhoE